MAIPRIYADFQNLDDANRLRLTCAGTLQDLERHGLQLEEGLLLTFYSDDADDQGQPDELRVEGLVHYDADGHCWVAAIDWAAIRHASEEGAGDAKPVDLVPMPEAPMSNVRNEQLREYLETFHRIYREKLAAVIPETYRRELLRVRHLEGTGIIGYVSTMFGAGYEYRPGNPGKIDVLSRSARIEEILFGCPRGLIQDDVNIFIRLRAPRFQMISCKVAGRLPLRLDTPNASATLENLDVDFRGRSTHIGFAEIFAERSADFWSKERAVERAMDEVLQAAVYVGGVERFKTSLDDFLERFKNRHVLLLGDFSEEGLRRIEAIKRVVERKGYYAFTLKDVKEFPEYDLRQKLTAVAPVCRFVVVDDSSRAGQSAEIPIIDFLRVVAVVLRLQGSDSTFVNRPLEATSRVIKEVEYGGGNLEQILDESIIWAECQIGELSQQYARAYPWRSTNTA